MFRLIAEFRAAMAVLFRTRRDKGIVAGLVLFGAMVSAAELLSAQLFSKIILPGGSGVRPMSDTIWLAVFFLVVFGGLRVINYAQSLYRVNVFEKAFHGSMTSRAGESWQWATAMELTSILTMSARITVIALGLFLLSPHFAIANLIIAFGIMEVFGVALKRQFATQREFRAKQNTPQAPTNATRVRARIRAGELAALLASIGVMILMVILIVFTIIGWMATGAALVAFLAIRMIGQMYSGISTGLMRFARARVNSDTTIVAEDDDEDA